MLEVADLGVETTKIIGDCEVRIKTVMQSRRKYEYLMKTVYVTSLALCVTSSELVLWVDLLIKLRHSYLNVNAIVFHIDWLTSKEIR